MLIRFTLFLLFLYAVACFNSCATIVSPNQYPVIINATPAGAEISITDRAGREIYRGTAPATVYLRSGHSYFRRGQYAVRVSKPGYDDQIFPIEGNINGWYFGNLLFGGIIGMLIVDPLSGAMYTINTPIVSVGLAKSEATSQLEIRTLDQVPDYMHPFMQRID